MDPSQGWMLRLTGTRRLLALLGLSSFSLALLSSQLRGGRVAEADTGDDTFTTGDGAGRPGRPVAPAAVLLDWKRPKRQL